MAPSVGRLALAKPYAVAAAVATQWMGCFRAYEVNVPFVAGDLHIGKMRLIENRIQL